jgi:DNA-binding IclR family transcriptional regulator
MEQHSRSVTIERSLDVLEVVARAGRAVSLGEVAERTDLPKATVHRVLSALEGRGYVSREDSRYLVGIRCFELGSLWAQNLDLRSVAAPHLRELNDSTGETVHLAIYDSADVVYIEKLDCHHAVTAQSYVGRRCPAFCVATGRALLAHQPWHEIDAVLRGPLPSYTALTVTDPEQLRAMLAEVRSTGYGVNRENYRVGVGGVAAPVRDHTGAVVAAVGCCVPVSRMGDAEFINLRDRTMQTSSAISAALGDPERLHRALPDSLDVAH